MRASNFEVILFHEDMIASANEKLEITQLEKVHSSVEIQRMAGEIENNYRAYFAPQEKDQPSIAAQYLVAYKRVKKSESRSRLKGYLSQMYGFLYDKEMLTMRNYKALEANIKQLQTQYDKDPTNKKLRSELVKLIENKGKISRELEIVGKYKNAFREIGISLKESDPRLYM